MDNVPIETISHARSPGPGQDISIALRAYLAPEGPARAGGRVVDPAGAPVSGARVEILEDPRASWDQPLAGELWEAVETGPDGAFAGSRPLPPGRRYLLRVTHAEHAGVVVHPLDPLVPSTLQREVVLPAGGSIAGLVTNASLQPLHEAQVSAVDLEAGNAAGDRQPERTVTSDASGQYVLAHLSAGRKRVTVRMPGYQAVATAPVILEDGAALSGLDFQLAAGVAIEGRVQDLESGQPLGGITLEVRPVAGRPLSGEASRTVQPEAAGAAPVLSAPPTPSEAEIATSATDGSFRIDGLREEAYLLAVVRPWQPSAPILRVRGGETNIRVRLRSQASIAGAVVDRETGRPLSTFSLAVSPSPSCLPVSWSQRKTFNDPSGHFLLEAVAPGTNYLLVEAPGFAPSSSQPLTIGAGERLSGVVIGLGRGSVLYGRVVDPRGQGIAGAQVVLLQELAAPRGVLAEGAVEGFRAGRWEVRTFEDGSYLMPASGPGRYALAVNHPAFASQHTEPFAIVGGDRQRLPDVVLELGAGIAGVVRDESGRADHLAVVMVVNADLPSEVHQAATDAEGCFIIRGLRPGSWRVGVIQRHGRMDFGAMKALSRGGGDLTTLVGGEVKRIELSTE